MWRCAVGQAEENLIGKRMMQVESIPLTLGSLACEMCVWLEKGYRTSEGGDETLAYASEILLHRRSFHVSSADNVN